MMLVMEFLPCK